MTAQTPYDRDLLEPGPANARMVVEKGATSGGCRTRAEFLHTDANGVRWGMGREKVRRRGVRKARDTVLAENIVERFVRGGGYWWPEDEKISQCYPGRQRQANPKFLGNKKTKKKKKKDMRKLFSAQLQEDTRANLTWAKDPTVPSHRLRFSIFSQSCKSGIRKPVANSSVSLSTLFMSSVCLGIRGRPGRRSCSYLLNSCWSR